MKVTTFALLTIAGMAGTTALVWASTRKPLARPLPQVAQPGPQKPPAPPAVDRHTFTAGGTLMMEGRLGHAVLPASSPSETFLFVDVTADPGQQATTPAPLDPDERTTVLAIEDIRVLADGRVYATVVLDPTLIPVRKTFGFILIEAEGGWRVDDVLDELEFSLP